MYEKFNILQVLLTLDNFKNNLQSTIYQIFTFNISKIIVKMLIK